MNHTKRSLLKLIGDGTQRGTKAIPPRERLVPDRFFLPAQLSVEQTLIESARDSEPDRSCLPPQLLEEHALIPSAKDSESDHSCLPPQLLEEHALIPSARDSESDHSCLPAQYAEEQAQIASASDTDSDALPPHPRCYTCGVYLGEGCERQVCGRRGYCEGYGY